MPGLRENLMERLSREIVIDSEFAALIPPLTDDEFERLEKSIIAEGCRDALVLWGNILIDGHNRYKICMKHNIEFRTIQREFKDRDDVLVWIMQNQLSRRNLSDFQRVELVRKCEDAVKAQAEQRRFSTLKQNQDTDKEKFPERCKTEKQSRDELGAMAGVSGKTYEHATAVLDKAPEPVIEATRRKELSINAAYGVTKLPESQQAEIAQRIADGEKAKSVIADMKAQYEFRQREYHDYQQEVASSGEDTTDNEPIDEQATDTIEVPSLKEILRTEKYEIVNISLIGHTREVNRINLMDVLKGYGRPMFTKYTGMLFLWIEVEQLEKIMNPSIFEVCRLKYQGIAYVLRKQDSITGLCLVSAIGSAEVPECKALLKEAGECESDKSRADAIKEFVKTDKVITTITLDDEMNIREMTES